jgi:hypothetical protein
VIQTILATSSGTYVIIQDQTSAVFAGDPETMVENLNNGAMLLEGLGSEYLQTQKANLFILE